MKTELRLKLKMLSKEQLFYIIETICTFSEDVRVNNLIKNINAKGINISGTGNRQALFDKQYKGENLNFESN